MDPIIIGRVVGAVGLKGWVKVQSFTRPLENLLSYGTVFLQSGSEWRKCPVSDTQHKGSSLRVLFSSCSDRNCASNLIGCDIGLFRADLPDALGNEFYWVDMIGLDVINQQDELLGKVTGLLETGAHDVLEIHGERNYLIPFVQNVHVIEVSLARGCIRVDWHIDD